MKIKRVSYSEAKSIISIKWLTVKPEYEYYALFNNNVFCSIIGIKVYEKTKIVKFHANYTPEKLRGRGYFSFLLKSVISCLDGYKLVADCTEYSKRIYENLGFVQTKQTQIKKHYEITRMERT